MLLNKEVSDLLILQLGHEMENHILYNIFANYFALEGLPNLETYYYKRAEEEKNHQAPEAERCFPRLRHASGMDDSGCRSGYSAGAAPDGTA